MATSPPVFSDSTPSRKNSLWRKVFFLVGYVEEGYGGLYKAPAKEERGKRTAKRIER